VRKDRAMIAIMSGQSIHVRRAKPEDAGGIARVYIESWHDTYAAILPMRLLCAMTLRGQAARWRATIRRRDEVVFVAESDGGELLGMTSFGPARDSSLGYDGEVYTLYVDPTYYGAGIGRAMLGHAFVWMMERGFGSCVIWAHAKNNARFFYEKMGGRLVAERSGRLMGDAIAECAFGWHRLALVEADRA
jgi:GNAT superfamily N-acetyltransferase